MPSGPTTGKSSFLTAVEAGNSLVPRPATGITALRTRERAAIGERSDMMALPAFRAELVAKGAELDRTGRGALENIRHGADTAGILDGDLRDVLLEGVRTAKNGDGASRAAAGDLGPKQAGGGAALTHGFHKKVDLADRQAAVVAITGVCGEHALASRRETTFIAFVCRPERVDEA